MRKNVWTILGETTEYTTLKIFNGNKQGVDANNLKLADLDEQEKIIKPIKNSAKLIEKDYFMDVTLKEKKLSSNSKSAIVNLNFTMFTKFEVSGRK